MRRPKLSDDETSRHTTSRMLLRLQFLRPKEAFKRNTAYMTAKAGTSVYMKNAIEEMLTGAIQNSHDSTFFIVIKDCATIDAATIELSHGNNRGLS